ncbi:hypothetical protein BGZ83_000316 [Gryganskiella cystojenkinii]|nr:hypothetical protein BGZ83_000316 [Gryganskiella cystojenkinii]
MKLITVLAAVTLLKVTLASPLVARATCTNIDQNAITSWASSQYAYSLSTMMNNLSPAGSKTGCVVAAQSQTNPQYYYHWSRDGALTMYAITLQYINAIDSGNTALQSTYAALVKDWISFEYGLQSISNPTVSITGNIQDNVGEPKFNIDGTAYTQPWGRPQNDGPALRTRTIVKFLRAYVPITGDTSYASSLYNMISRDMSYVVRHYADACTSGTPCVDLWEERSDSHFYTDVSQRRGLKEGAYYMNTWGSNSTLASQYLSVASALEPRTEAHWVDSLLYYKEMLSVSDRNSPDVAIVLGSIQSRDETDPFVSPSSDKMLASAYRYATQFRGRFSINKNRMAYAPAVGRYLEDVYNGSDGVNNNGAGAWLLAINAVAELHYVAAAEFRTAGQAKVTVINQPIFAYYGVNATSGSILTGSQLSTLVANIFGEGDSYLGTLQYYMGSEQDMPEQFNPVSGARQGAKHLTWSYASFITAVDARNAFLAL